MDAQTTSTFAVSIPAVFMLIVSVLAWWFKKSIDRDEKARERRFEDIERKVAKAEEDIRHIDIEMEKRVTYEHFDEQMKTLRDDIRDAIRGLKEDMRMLIRGGQ